MVKSNNLAVTSSSKDFVPSIASRWDYNSYCDTLSLVCKLNLVVAMRNSSSIISCLYGIVGPEQGKPITLVSDAYVNGMSNHSPLEPYGPHPLSLLVQPIVHTVVDWPSTQLNNLDLVNLGAFKTAGDLGNVQLAAGLVWGCNVFGQLSENTITGMYYQKTVK